MLCDEFWGQAFSLISIEMYIINEIRNSVVVLSNILFEL